MPGVPRVRKDQGERRLVATKGVSEASSLVCREFAVSVGCLQSQGGVGEGRSPIRLKCSCHVERAVPALQFGCKAGGCPDTNLQRRAVCRAHEQEEEGERDGVFHG